MKTTEVLLNHAVYEYKELSDTWRDIERKAQGTIAAVGIFLVGISIAITKLESTDLITLSLVIMSIISLTLSAIFSICALQVSVIDTIEDTTDIRIEAQKLIATGESNDNVDAFIISRVKYWERASNALLKENTKKAKTLNTAHNVLVAAIALVVTSLLFTLCKT